jgi:hypothetical protein
MIALKGVFSTVGWKVFFLESPFEKDHPPKLL